MIVAGASRGGERVGVVFAGLLHVAELAMTVAAHVQRARDQRVLAGAAERLPRLGSVADSARVVAPRQGDAPAHEARRAAGGGKNARAVQADDRIDRQLGRVDFPEVQVAKRDAVAQVGFLIARQVTAPHHHRLGEGFDRFAEASRGAARLGPPQRIAEAMEGEWVPGHRAAPPIL